MPRSVSFAIAILLVLSPILAEPVLAQSYKGPGSDWVSLLLSRSGGWSCPAASVSGVAASAPTAAENRCVRDAYVNAAVQAAWGAECEARHHRITAAYQDESSMASSLQSAASLCSNAPYIASSDPDTSCTTMTVVSCNDLAPFQNQRQSSQSIEQQADQALQESSGMSLAPTATGGNIETQALQNLQTSTNALDQQEQQQALQAQQAAQSHSSNAALRRQAANDADEEEPDNEEQPDDQATPSSGSVTADDIVDAFKQGMQRAQQNLPPPPKAPVKASAAPSKPTPKCTGAGNAVTGYQSCPN
jgi:hypothetical protein